MSGALHRLFEPSMDLTNIYRAIAPYKTSSGDWARYRPVLLRVLKSAQVKKPDPYNSLRYVGDPLNDTEKKWLYKLFQRTQGYTGVLEEYPDQEPPTLQRVVSRNNGDDERDNTEDAEEDAIQRAEAQAVAEAQAIAQVRADLTPQQQTSTQAPRVDALSASGSSSTYARSQPGLASTNANSSVAAQSDSSVAATPPPGANRGLLEQITAALRGTPASSNAQQVSSVSNNAPQASTESDIMHRDLNLLNVSPIASRMSHRAPHHPRFWRGTTEAQMHSSWRAPMHRHVRHPGRRMRTGAGMSQECEKEFANEHDTTVKELASDLKDSLPLGLSLALRAATGNTDLVKAADKIKTKHGHVDYAGVLKGVLPESVTHAAEQAKKLRTGDAMPISSSQEQDKDLSQSLEALQKRVPVWQRSRLTALREFVARDLQKVQRRETMDVNSEAANLIARLGILKAAQQANLGSRHADTIAVHLK